MVTQNVFGRGFFETPCTYIDNNKIKKLVIFYLIILTYRNSYSWISINILLHLLKKFEEYMENIIYRFKFYKSNYSLSLCLYFCIYLSLYFYISIYVYLSVSIYLSISL